MQREELLASWKVMISSKEHNLKPFLELSSPIFPNQLRIQILLERYFDAKLHYLLQPTMGG